MHGATRPVATFAVADRKVEFLEGHDALWAIVRRPGKGGLAIRAAHLPRVAAKLRKVRADLSDTCRIDLEGPMGAQTVRFSVADAELPVLRIMTTLIPAAPLLIPFLPSNWPSSHDQQSI